MGKYFEISKREPIAHETLATKATAVLRDMIIAGEFPPGAKITEVSLAEAIGVSRACMREAFIRLEREGLLTKVQNHYTQVVRFTAADVDEICELRISIETMALRKCIDNKSLDIDQLSQKAARLVGSMNMESDDSVIDWLEDDMAFHHEIVAAAGNRRALRFWESLSNQVVAMLYMTHRIHPELISRPTDTHVIIIQAIRQDDYEQAANLLQKHITAAIAWIKEAVESQQPTAERTNIR